MAAGLLELPIPPKKHRSPVSLCPCWINARKDWAGLVHAELPRKWTAQDAGLSPIIYLLSRTGDAPHGTVAITKQLRHG
jgi:hypothetical protein